MTRGLTQTIAAFLIASCAMPTLAAAAHHARHAQHAKHGKHQSKTPAKAVARAAGPLYATRPEVMQIASEIALRRQLDPEWVRQTIGQALYMPAIARAVLPPPVGVPKNWTLYRSRFIDAVRIQAGVKFWQANRELLQRAEAETGVPAQLIVGIIGVETIYGRQTGDYRVIDALSTLAFDFPAGHPKFAARSAFFLDELETFLSLTARNGIDPLALRGSYAGAMGLPQFMPSSWAKYAVDFDGDGRIDLFHSAADVIGSVAHYFKAFRWQPGMPTHYPVAFDPARLDLSALLAPDIVPTFTPEGFAVRGAVLSDAARVHPGPLALVELQNGDQAPIYLAGTDNFYALTRYNWSSYYALAVIELGQEVAAVMPK